MADENEIAFKFESGKLSGFMEVLTLAAEVLDNEAYKKLESAMDDRFNEQREITAKLRDALKA